MAKGKVIVNENICKGCGLCITVCPKNILQINKSKVNSKGYNAITCVNEDECIGCKSCAMICPDVVFTIYRNN